MRIPTAAGELDLEPEPERAACSACLEDHEHGLRIAVVAPTRSATVRICGTCLAAALSVKIGAEIARREQRPAGRVGDPD